MKFASEDYAICVTCGTQYDVPYSEAPKSCRICDDPRQFVPPSGQSWSSLALSRDQQKNTFEKSPIDPRVTYIYTTPTTPNEDPLRPSFGSSPTPKLGIGQRAILLETAAGNVLWDCIAYIDDETVDFINSKGGLKAIVISHPHFYTTHLEWARVFACPVYTAKDDEGWLNREDREGSRRLMTGKQEVVDGVTAIQVGGHFDGSLILHWDNSLFHADSFMTTPSAYYHKDRLPGTTSYCFMWSYPNMIPLPPDKIHGIWKTLKPFHFDTTYGGFMGQDNRRPDLKEQLLQSMKIFVRIAGHRDATVLQESLS